MVRSESVETLSLDAGGVLLFPNWWRVSRALAVHGVAVDPWALAEADPHARRSLDDAATVRRTDDRERGFAYFDLLLTQVGVSSSAATRSALGDLAAYHLRRNLWEHVPQGVRPALVRLRELGLRLVLVSNANGTLLAHLDRLGLTSFFDAIVDSADEGVEKPDPRLFEIALGRANARPDTAVHVGDLYHVDVVGARQAGLRPVLFDPVGLYPRCDCPRVASLEDLAGDLAEGRF